MTGNGRNSGGVRRRFSVSIERAAQMHGRTRRLILALGAVVAVSVGLAQTAWAGYAAFIVDRYTGVVLHHMVIPPFAPRLPCRISVGSRHACIVCSVNIHDDHFRHRL